MIKVIQHGKTYQTSKCPNCNAVLEYTLKDLTYDYDIETDITKYFLRCPECGHKFIARYFKEGN